MYTSTCLGMLQYNGNRSDLWICLLLVMIAVTLAPTQPQAAYGQAKSCTGNLLSGRDFKIHDL